MFEAFVPDAVENDISDVNTNSTSLDSSPRKRVRSPTEIKPIKGQKRISKR